MPSRPTHRALRFTAKLERQRARDREEAARMYALANEMRVLRESYRRLLGLTNNDTREA